MGHHGNRDIHISNAYETVSTGDGLFQVSLAQRWREVLTGVDPEPWVEFLLYSHPALEKRIAMAKRFQQESNYSS